MPIRSCVFSIVFILVLFGCQEHTPSELPQTPEFCDVCELVGRQYVAPEPINYVKPADDYPNVTPSECAAAPYKCKLWSTDFVPVLEIHQGAYRDNFDGLDCDLNGDGTDDANWGGVLTFWGHLCWGGAAYPQGVCKTRTGINYLMYTDILVEDGVFSVYGWLLEDGGSMLIRSNGGAECDTRVPQSGMLADCNTPWDVDWIEFNADFPIVGNIASRLEYTGPPTEYSGDLAAVLGWSDECGSRDSEQMETIPADEQHAEVISPVWTEENNVDSGLDFILPTGSIDARGYVTWNYEDSASTYANDVVVGASYHRVEWMEYQSENPATAASGYPRMQLDIKNGNVRGTVNWNGYIRQGFAYHEDFSFRVVGTATIRNPTVSPWQWIVDIELESPVYTGNPSIDNLVVNVTAFNATQKVFVSKAPYSSAVEPAEMSYYYSPVSMIRNETPLRFTNSGWK